MRKFLAVFFPGVLVLMAAMTAAQSHWGSKKQAVEGKARKLDVQESSTELRIRLDADVLFDFDRADLRPEAADILRQAADVIRQHPAGDVRITGYTDSKGTADYNQMLSVRRADSVKSWLAGEGKIPVSRLKTEGKGASDPVAPNTKPDGSDDPDGRQKNRRVEIRIRKT